MMKYHSVTVDALQLYLADITSLLLKNLHFDTELGMKSLYQTMRKLY